MNIRTLLFMMCGLVFSATAQEDEVIRNSIFAKRTFTNHFFGADHSPLDFNNYRGGFELNYVRSLGKINVSFPFRANVIRLPDETSNRRTLGLDGILQLPYKPGNRFVPYLLAGVGGVIEPGNSTDFQVPLGAGINLKINPVLAINFQTEYRLSISGDRPNYIHGIGLGIDLNRLIQPVAPVEVVADRDNDGVPDSSDECPDIAGLTNLGGCPDSDGDGIGDQVDSCPDLAGLAEFKGCPDTDGDGFFDLIDECPDQAGVKAFKGCPDTDEDGIPDKEDNCPTERGAKENNGCPVKDQDGDGIPDGEDECPNVKGNLNGCPDDDNDGVKNSEDKCPKAAGPINASGCPDSDDDGLDDSQDKCPNKAGPLSNSGCPVISEADKAVLEFAVQEVNFQTGSAELTPNSLPVLTKLVDILNRNPAYDLVISGHTDSTGEAEKNQTLSQARAEACRNYLLTQGVNNARMSPIGYGATRPKASNETIEGRLLNRRVEFDLRLR